MSGCYEWVLWVGVMGRSSMDGCYGCVCYGWVLWVGVVWMGVMGGCYGSV